MVELLESAPSPISASAGPAEKVYSGATVNGESTVTVENDLKLRPLKCLDFFTPTFGWGYLGGASKELAIAILHDHFGSRQPMVEQRVLKLYNAFTDEFVSKFSRSRRWSLPSLLVGKWVEQQERIPIVV